MTPGAPVEAVQPRLFYRTGIQPVALDDDAVKVVARLRRKGHESFLVGGCVRDLLLSRRPKDFDVATAARPRQVKSLFRNCRIIGRRFKLAHLHFDDKILEVSTFRRRPDQNGDDEDDLLIRSDNVFGSANEDAHRRDFTINALFLDPEADCIHDYVGGIEDIEAGVVRTIGDPLTRMKEDPVRIVRAVKFAARLSLRIEDATWAAMREAAPDLARAAAPRLLEELLRLMRSGTALKAFQLLRDCGALPVLLPEVSRFLDRADLRERTFFWRLLEATDSVVRRSKEPVTAPVLFGALLLPALEGERQSAVAAGEARDSDLGKTAEALLGPVLRRLNFSRADSGRLKRIAVVQRRFEKPRGKRTFKTASFLKQEYFAEALQLHLLCCIARDDGWEEHDAWQRLQDRHLAGAEPGEPETAAGAPAAPTAGNEATRTETAAEPLKRRRRRRRGGRTPAAEPAPIHHDRDRKRGARSRRRGRQRQAEPDLPPLPDVQLDPNVVPTYGSVLGDTGSADKIQLESSKGRRARKKDKAEEAPYIPPPPPPQGATPRPRRTDDPDPDTFGDW